MYTFQPKDRGYVEIFRDGKSVGIGTADQAKGFGFNGTFSTPQQRVLPQTPTSSVSNLSVSKPQILNQEQLNEIAKQNAGYYANKGTTPTPATTSNAPTPEETRTKQLEDVVGTIPGLKELMDTLLLQIDTQMEQGKKVNPDLTITPELAQKFVDQASTELDPYYQELINQHKQDLTISFRQMQEDYNKQIEREQPQFKQQLENLDQTEANQGTAYSSGRVQREQQAIQSEQQKLDDLLQANQRSVEKTGLASERAIGSRNFADLGIPTLQSYSASRNTIAPRGELTPTGTRSLYTPQTGLYGTLPAQQKVDLAQRTGELKNEELNTRILNAGGLARTI